MCSYWTECTIRWEKSGIFTSKHRKLNKASKTVDKRDLFLLSYRHKRHFWSCLSLYFSTGIQEHPLFLNLLSPWSRTALSPAGWPFSWQCWVCWGTSPTQSTWPTRWIGCGGNTRTRRSLRWSPCPGWWSGWPLTSFWSGDIMDRGGKELRNCSEQKPASLKARCHPFTIRMLPSQHSQWFVSSHSLKPSLVIPWHSEKCWCFLTRRTFLKIRPPLNLTSSQSNQFASTPRGRRWTVSAGDGTFSRRLLRFILTPVPCQQQSL